MAQHTKVSLATSMPVYFPDPHSPWQRPSNENTKGLYRKYLPKGTVIPDHQPYLTTIAEEINNRPRRQLSYPPPPRHSLDYSLASPMLLQRLDTTDASPHTRV